MSEALKTKGNEAFASKDYESAIQLYSEAIQLDSRNPVLFSNRSLCYIKLEEWHKALEDCDYGLKYNPDTKTTVKLLFRKAASFKGMGSRKLAKEYFNKVIELDPENQPALNELNNFKDDMEDVVDSSRMEIPITKVEVLPQEFQDILEPTRPIQLEQEAHKIEIKGAEDEELVLKEASELFTDRAKSQPEKISVPKETMSTMSLLSMLKTIPSANKDKAYTFIVEMNPDDLIDNFTYGVDPEFLTFFLEAAVNVLSKNYQNDKASKVVFVLQRLAGLPRFDLCKAFLDDNLKTSLSSCFSDNGDSNLVEKYNQVLM